MRLYEITTDNHQHFESLLRDYVIQGFIPEKHSGTDYVLLGNTEQIHLVMRGAGR